MGKIVSVDDLEDGMILEETVSNNFGQVLIASGAEMNANKIKALKTWGVSTVVVESAEETAIDYDDETVEKARNRIAKRIFWTPRNEPEKDLITVALKRASSLVRQGAK